jgi:hypothetical protein
MHPYIHPDSKDKRTQQRTCSRAPIPDECEIKIVVVMMLMTRPINVTKFGASQSGRNVTTLFQKGYTNPRTNSKKDSAKKDKKTVTTTVGNISKSDITHLHVGLQYRLNIAAVLVLLQAATLRESPKRKRIG